MELHSIEITDWNRRSFTLVLKYESLKSKAQNFVVKSPGLIFGSGLKKDSKFSAPIVYIRASLRQYQSTWLYGAMRG
jgi:hypothetical protein